MIRRITLVVALVFVLMWIGCSSNPKVKQDQLTAINTNSNNKPTSPSDTAVDVKPEPPELLCSRLAEIKMITFRGERGYDKTFDAFLDAGDDVVPCLIKRVLDSSKMKSPIHVPGYAGI